MYNLLCADRQAVPFYSRCDFVKLSDHAEVPRNGANDGRCQRDGSNGVKISHRGPAYAGAEAADEAVITKSSKPVLAPVLK